MDRVTASTCSHWASVRSERLARWRSKLGQTGLFDLGAQGRDDRGGVAGPGRHPVPLHLVGHDLGGPRHLVLTAGEGHFHGGPEDVHVQKDQAAQIGRRGIHVAGHPEVDHQQRVIGRARAGGPPPTGCGP